MSASLETDTAVVEFGKRTVRENLCGRIYSGIRESHGQLGES